MPSTNGATPAMAATYESNQRLLTRHEALEHTASAIDPHSTLSFTLSTDLASSPATVVVAFVTAAELSAVKGEGATLPPLQRLPHPPPLPAAAAADLLHKKGGTLTLYSTSGHPHVLLVNVGTAGTDDEEAYRVAVWTAVTELKASKVQYAALLLPSTHTVRMLDVAVRISVLSLHSFNKYRLQEPPHRVSSLALVYDSAAASEAELQSTLRVASAVSEGTAFAREVACDRADCITPSYLQRIAEMVAASHGLGITVLDAEELQRQGLYLLASVGQGARDGEKARLIVLEYRGDPSSERVIALCGKGICFDAGGLHLKATGQIEDMHLDCSGSAVTLASIKVLAALKVKANVVATLSVAENMIGPHAQKPLAIWPTVRGTVQITNTDCEGRLALVDAFTYVQRRWKVHTILDCATLTLGVWMICGDLMSAVFANDDEVWSGLQKAGDAVSERVWRFPVWAEHMEQLRDPAGQSDWVNHVAKVGESCTAAAFLKLFVDDGVRWGHVDCGGVSMTTKANRWLPRQGTGFGVQLLCEYVMRAAAAGQL